MMKLASINQFFTKRQKEHEFIMGNASAENIFLDIDQAGMLVAGSTVSGMVRANVPTGEKFAGKIMEKINLLFIGKEDACVHYKVTKTTGTGDNQRRIRRSRYSYSTCDIVRMVIPLDTPSDMLNEGNFEIPFEFQIPDQVPSSLNCSHHRSWCKIRYKLKLDIEHARDMEIPIEIIARPPRSSPIPNLVSPRATDIVQFCCFQKGKIVVAANVDNTRVEQNENIKVDLGIKNDSTTELKIVSATIDQSIGWHSKKHKAYWKLSIGKYFNLNHDNFKAKSKSKDSATMKQVVDNGGDVVKLGGVSDDTYRKLLEAVKNRSNQIILRLPMVAFNSYQGSLIKVNHDLTIKVKTPIGSTDPTIIIPLQIVSPNSVQAQFQNHPELTPIPILYGGEVVDTEKETTFDNFDLPPVGIGPQSYDYPSLLQEIQSSLNVRTKLQDLLKDSQWREVTIALVPKQFLEIMSKFESDFDKADVIEILVAEVNNFTCVYAAMILRQVPKWLRIQTIQKMVPHCTDIKTNKDVLLKDFSEWERICTERDFDNVMNT